MLLGVGVAYLQGLDVRLPKFWFFSKLPLDSLGEDGEVEVDKKRKRADVDDVFQQLPEFGVVEGLVAQLCERNTDHRYVGSREVGRKFLGRVVDEVAAGQEFPVILEQGLAVDRDHHIVAAPPAEITVFADPDFVPGGQALDVRGEDILRADRHAQPEDGLGKKVVGAGRTGAVDVGKADDEVVDPFYLVHFISLLPPAICRCISSFPRRRSGSVRRRGRSAGRHSHL
ncbi:MAG: hypothetical protein ACD_75C02335G0002 [uncultured bacterium]|nr:MAG: hypothetical protein ACD_75C02335G0002 [uncultured bacterium]